MNNSFLHTSIDYLKGVGPNRSKLFKKELKIFTYQDLLSVFPYRYVDKTKYHKIDEINILDFVRGLYVLNYAGKIGDFIFENCSWNHIEIENGEFVYLIGRTGSGKTSLIKSLYADIKLNGGEGSIVGVELNNLEDNKIPLLRRKLGIIFQDFKLLSDRSVAENLKFVLKATGWNDESKINSRIIEVLEKVHIEKLINKFGASQESSLVWKPMELINLKEEDAETVIMLYEALDEIDDVQSVYSNFEIL